MLPSLVNSLGEVGHLVAAVAAHQQGQVPAHLSVWNAKGKADLQISETVAQEDGQSF